MGGTRMGRLSGDGVVVPLAAGQVMIHENITNTCEDATRGRGGERRSSKPKGLSEQSTQCLRRAFRDTERCFLMDTKTRKSDRRGPFRSTIKSRGLKQSLHQRIKAKEEKERARQVLQVTCAIV